MRAGPGRLVRTPAGSQTPFSSRARQAGARPHSAAHRAGGRRRPQVREAVELALAQEELGQLAHAVQPELELQRRQRLLVDEFGVHAAQGVRGRRRGRSAGRRLQARGPSRDAGGRGRAARVQRRHRLQVRAAGGRRWHGRKGLEGGRRPEGPVRQGPGWGRRRRAQRSPPRPQAAVQARARVRLQRPERVGAVGGRGGRRPLHQAVALGEHQVVGHDGGPDACGRGGRGVSAGVPGSGPAPSSAARDPRPVPSPQPSQAKENGTRLVLLPSPGRPELRAPERPVVAAPCSRHTASGSETSAPRPRLQRPLIGEAGLPRPRALIGWVGRSWAGLAAPPGFRPAPPGAPPFGPQAAPRAKRAALGCLALFKGFGLTVPDSAWDWLEPSSN